MFTLGHLIIEDGTRFEITGIELHHGQLHLRAETKWLTRPAGPIGRIEVYGEDGSSIYVCYEDNVLGECKNQRWVPFELNLIVYYTVKTGDLLPTWHR